ncbi:MAG TPA: DUF447 family protein [Pyrodictium sp.]|nr:DUF447 family protein [Pyrodictium sp.]
MTLLIASCISSQNMVHDLSELARDLLNDTYFETIVLLKDGETVYATPLGVKVENGLFKARVFPDTKLYSLILNTPLALLCFTLDPLTFYLATIEHTIDCSKCNLLLLVEITDRKSYCSCSAVQFTLNPVAIVNLQYRPQPYTRILGCFIELLVLYSRAKHFIVYPLKATSMNCESFCRTIRTSLDCIEHATQNTTLLGMAKRLTENIIKQLYILGCYCDSYH